MVLSILAQTHQKSNKSDPPLLHKEVEEHHHQEHKVVLSGVDTLTITAGGMCSPSDLVLEQFNIWNEYQNQYEKTALNQAAEPDDPVSDWDHSSHSDYPTQLRYDHSQAAVWTNYVR